MSTAPDDTPARLEIRRHLDATLFVEAGAGTGKTTALVGRIVELVANDQARLRNIAAITFTEAAAGELRDRVREELERLAGGHHDEEYAAPDLDDAGRARRESRATVALAEVDSAAISTLHGFAQRILAEHPFEAGLPPTFDVYDEIRSSVAFDERWSDFLDRLLDDPAQTHALQRALVTGITLDQLRSVALEFNRNWDLVADAQLARPDAVTVDQRRVVDALADAERAAGWCTDANDKLLIHIEGLAGFRTRLADARGELETLQLLAQAPRLPCRYGQKDSWHGHVDEVRDLLAAADDARLDVVGAASQQALAQLLGAVRDLTLAAADQRRRDGTLEFHDLLVQARDLLRHHGEVVSTLHGTYSHLLIDEFQDTDPIQAELAVRIATDDPDAGAKPWTELTFPPGALFFVGDAKQAIYRFRRADIGLFLDVRSSYVDEPLALTRNRRSVPGIIDWVNATFAALIGEGVAGVQPAYQPLVAHRPAHAHGPGASDPVVPVVLLGDGVDEQNMAAIRATEATDIADAVRRIRDEGWPVGDDGRAAKLADICVLIPTRTPLPALEDALESAGLPYRVESSSLVYASPEVRDLLTVLRAVDDPTDEVAVVAALRSPMFACGDDDLVEHRRANGSWDYRKPPPDEGVDGPVAAGLHSLHQLHDERWWHDVSGLIQRVLAERRLLELALDDRRPRDVWRRLHFVTDQARAFTDAYGTDLRRYLAWAEVQCAEDARVVEAILPESDDDAVRIMTVHASKGLEFPIVVLSGLNVADRSRRSGVDVLWRDTSPEVRLSKQASTPGYAQLATVEDTMESYEQHRLLYVAATRARDHLVVSLHHKRGTSCHAARLAAQSEAGAGLWRRLEAPPAEPVATDDTWAPTLALVFADDPTGPTSPGSSTPPAPPPQDGDLLHDSVDARQRWIDRRAQLVGAGARPTTLAATAVAKLARDRSGATGGEGSTAGEPPDETEADLDLPPWRRGRAGTAIGRAVHGVLQLIDLTTGEGLADLARGQAVAEGVTAHAPEIERLVRVALAAPIVREAVASGRYWRELYVGTPVGSHTLEGFIDLLVEGPDGLVVVDYKTDAATTAAEIDAAVEHYRLQAASYAVAVEGVLGRPVTRAVFLFLRAPATVEREIGDLAAAKAEVEAILTSP